MGEREDRVSDLERQFPGWQIWTSGETWCARPLPVINADSPEELAADIRTAHSQPPHGSPALASLRSYRARLRQLREYEEAAGAAWRSTRAEPRYQRQARRIARAAQAEPVDATRNPSARGGSTGR